jgi:riboflavin kinase/FMN adenylyltransferase
VKVLHSLNEYKNIKSTTVTIGSFDGVHKGHQKVLRQLQSIAKQSDTQSVVISFVPHPRIFFDPNTALKMLNTTDEKIALLEKQGLDYLILQTFDRTFASKNPDDFIKEMVSTLKMKHILMGYDHSFGKNAEGNYELVSRLSKKYNYETHLIEEAKIDDIKLSSTAVREALLAGNIEKANRILAYPYALTGLVVKGNQLGRTIGFPTANIEVSDKYKLFPKQGVYVVSALVAGQSVYGMMNLGMRPTVDGKKMVIEVYLFNFNQDIYHKTIQVSFLKRLRDEQKFPSVEALKMQLIKDEATSKKYIESIVKQD